MMKMKPALLLPLVLASCTTLYFDFRVYASGSGGGSGTSTGAGGAGGASSSATGSGGGPLCPPGATQSCYSGAPGTLGQGICKAGTQTCAANGASWGSCDGEVLPQPEDCATPLDENCDGLAPPCTGGLGWAHRFGEVGDQYGAGVAVDGTGAVTLAGYFSGTADFGGGPLVASGVPDVFVTRLDPAGHHVWSKRFGDTSDQKASAVAVDSAGNVVVAGNFYGTVDFGGGPLTSAGAQDIFVAKLDPTGQHLWSKRFSGVGAAARWLTSLALDAAGDVLLAGYFYGDVDLGGGTLTSAGGADVFAARLDKDGGHLWSKRFGGTGDEFAMGVAAGGAGDAFITGSFSATMDLGCGPLTGVGGQDVYVARLGPAGACSWSARFGDAATQVGTGIAVDATGNVLVTGYFAGGIDFGGGALTSAGTYDVFVAKLDGAGAYGWARRFGDADAQAGGGVTTDMAGNVVVTGIMKGQADFGGGPLASGGGKDIFVAKLDGAGAHLWSKRYGDDQDQGGTSVAVDPAGNVLVTGYMAGTVDFGGGALVSPGGWDVFVAKLDP
jgi:hypothetical protein